MSDEHKSLAPTPALGETRVMHPLVVAAMAGGTQLDPETLRELLAVQREWEAGEARKAFTRALTALKRDLPSVIDRDKLVDFTSAKGRTTYRHATLAHVMDAIQEPLVAHGFSLSWTPEISDREVRVTCTLTHAEGHSERCTLAAAPDQSGGKNAVQAIGSTSTYLQRYTALALLGIATADQDDADERADDPDRIDPRASLQAISQMGALGKSAAELERYLDAKVDRWTAAHLAKLRAWYRELMRKEDDE